MRNNKCENKQKDFMQTLRPEILLLFSIIVGKDSLRIKNLFMEFAYKIENLRLG